MKNEIINLRTADKFYPVIELCKDDLRAEFQDNKKALNKINKMTDDEMVYFMGKLADSLQSSCFWETLKIVFEDRFLN